MSQQQKLRNNDSSDSSDTSDTSDTSDSSSAPQIIRANAGTPATWSPLRIPSNQELFYSLSTKNIDDDYHVSDENQSSQIRESERESEQESEQESERESEQESEQEIDEPVFPSFMTGLVIIVSLITVMAIPSIHVTDLVTAALVGAIGLVYNYRILIGPRNMRILAGVALYALGAAAWLMFEWKYQMQITPRLANKTNMFNEFVTTHIQHIVLWPLTITINFMRRSAYPLLSVIITNISNFYTKL